MRYSLFVCTIAPLVACAPVDVDHRAAAVTCEEIAGCDWSEGCTDPFAINYDAAAIIDDGSCEYEFPGGEEEPPAEDPPAEDPPGDEPTEDDLFGCTDPAADNYDPDAFVDDGSCVYTPAPGYDEVDYEPLFGCTDPEASNYNEYAVVDDGSCVYEAEEDPPDDDLGLGGCTDPTALNYDPDAWVDDGSCAYGSCPEGYEYCDSGVAEGLCISEGGSCDEDPCGDGFMLCPAGEPGAGSCASAFNWDSQCLGIAEA